jgi:hypothetical protein
MYNSMDKMLVSQNAKEPELASIGIPRLMDGDATSLIGVTEIVIHN